MEEREKILATGTLEQKKEAFKDDEELMRETTKFVSEVIQMAITEASKRIMFTEVNIPFYMFYSHDISNNAVVECNYSLIISYFRKVILVKVSFIIKYKKEI